MLALRVWLGTYALWGAQLLAKLSLGRSSRAAQDWALARTASRLAHSEIVWPDEREKSPAQVSQTTAPKEEIADSATRVEGSPLRAAE
jgi:multidrug efflux pump